MNELKVFLSDYLSKTQEIDWLILHKIANEGLLLNDIEFSFADGKENISEPFQTNLGYISIKNDEHGRVIGFFNDIIP